MSAEIVNKIDLTLPTWSQLFHFSKSAKSSQNLCIYLANPARAGFKSGASLIFTLGLYIFLLLPAIKILQRTTSKLVAIFCGNIFFFLCYVTVFLPFLFPYNSCTLCTWDLDVTSEFHV